MGLQGRVLVETVAFVGQIEAKRFFGLTVAKSTPV
jgi:hypothetical protein